MKESEYFTVAEAAQLLKVSPSTIWRWIQSAKLPAFKVGGRTIRVKKNDVERMVEPIQPLNERESILQKIRERPSPDELRRRQEIVARIRANRFSIAPLNSTDLIREIREGAEESYGANG